MMRHRLQLLLLIVSGACSPEVPSAVDPPPEDPRTSNPPPAPQAERAINAEPLIPPPARRPVEGIHGFASLSTVEFQARPDSPHRLSASYTFPDRARWYLEPAGAATGQRTVIYRSGPQAWVLAPGAEEAARFQGQQETQVFLQLELRRAALFWPRGIAWEDGLVDGPVASVRIAELETGGLIAARFRSEGSPPSSFFSRLPGGAAFEEFRDVQWSDGPLGPRPTRWTLFSGTEEVWTETIEELQTKVRYVDSHFLPPHLRDLPPDGDADAILLVEVPARCRKRHPLSTSSWADAIAQAQELIATTRELGLPGTVDPNPVFELDADGLPCTLLIRLILSGEEPPEGWEEAAAESALSRLNPNGRLPSLAEINQLRAARPAGTHPGTPRLRLGLVQGQPFTAQLLLPLSPSAPGD
jgi:hypothetical protein